MRFLLIDCALTVMFAGGCALVLGAASLESDQGFFRDPIIYVLLLAVVANIAFMGLALKANIWGGTPLIWAGVVYSVTQIGLFMGISKWHGGPGVVFSVLLLFALKGLVLVMAGESRKSDGMGGR